MEVEGKKVFQVNFVGVGDQHPQRPEGAEPSVGKSDSKSSAGIDSVFSGGGEMGALMRALDWSPARLRKLMVPGKTLRVTGWLFDDLEHVNAAENTHSAGVHNWRATVWEIHPVTGFSVLP